MKITSFFRWTRLHGRKGVLLAVYTVAVVLALAALRPQRYRFSFITKDVLSLPPLSDNLPAVGQFNRKHWHSSHLLPRRIRQAHYANFIDLLRRVDQVFRKWDIPYMMTAGTLIGSYFHHDMIPWDDSFNLVADYLRRKDIKVALKSMGQMYKMYEMKYHFRVYRIDGVQVHNLPLRGPRLDIFYFTSDGEKMWECHRMAKSYPLSAAFPLTLRPFGSLWLPAPNNVKIVLAKYHGFDAGNDDSRSCLSNRYLQMNEYPAKQYKVSCSALMKSYPFVVRRKPTGDGLIVETLSIANVTVQHVAISAASSKRP